MAAAVTAIATYFGVSEAIVLAVAVSIASVTASMVAVSRMNAGRSQQERKQILRSSAAPCNVVVGRNRSAGVLTYAVEEAGEQDENEQVYLVVTHASHPLHKVDNYKLNDDLLTDLPDVHHAQIKTDSGSINRWHKGEIETDYMSGAVHDRRSIVLSSYDQGATAADATLLANAADWKTDMVGKGIGWYWIRLSFDQEQWPTGLPNITAEKWGVEVEDLRTGKVAWTANNALIILWYLRTYLKYDDDELLLDTFTSAANICDETVTNNDGTTEPRYTIGGEFDLNEEPAAILDKMLASCAGEWVRIGGRLGLTVGAYYGPATITITEDELIGSVELQPEVELGDAANIVRGTFVDPNQDYNEVDYPEVRIDDWVDSDGEEIVDDLNLSLVQSGWQAQRLANIHLMRKRHGMKLKLPCNLRAFGAVPGTYVKLQLESIGIEGISCRVLDWAFSESDGVTLMVRRELPSMYNDAVGQSPYIPPIVTGPPAPIAPTNITTTLEGHQITLHWRNQSPLLKRTLVRVYGVTTGENGLETASLISSLSAMAPHNSVLLPQLAAGVYKLELQAQMSSGQLSAPTSVQFTLLPPAVPTHVDVESGNSFVNLRPSYNGATPLGTTFEFYFRGDEPNGPRLLRGDNRVSYQHVGLAPNKTYYFSVRAVNPLGASDYVDVSATTTLNDDVVEAILDKELEEVRQELNQLVDEATQDYPTESEVTDIITDILDPEDPRVGLVNEVNTILEQHAEDTNQHARITTVDRAIVAETETRTQALREVSAKFGDVEASITEAEQAIATERKAVAESVRQLTATDAATLSGLRRVEADVTGNASTIRSIKGRVENPHSGLSATFGLAQQASTTAQGAATSSTHVKNMVEDKKTGLAATAQLALAAQQAVDGVQKSLATLKASLDQLDDGPMTTAEIQMLLAAIRDDVNKNISAIATLNSTVTGPDGSASSMLELVTQINNDLQIYRAQAQLSVDANGNVALIKMGATADETEIKFQAGTVVWLDDAGRPVVYWDTQRKTYHFDGTFEATNIIGDLAAGAVIEVNRGASGTPLHDTPVTTVIDVDIEAEAFAREAIISALTIEIGRVTSYADISIWRNGKQLSSRRTSGGVVALSATLPANRAHNLQIKVKGVFNSSAHDPQGQGASVYAKGPALLSLQRSSSKITVNPV